MYRKTGRVLVSMWPKATAIIMVLLFNARSVSGNEIGSWSFDSAGMPLFEYEGDLPFYATDKNGEKVLLPEDPWFLLGNYRFNLFAHVSGNYQIIAGDRAWARVNQGEEVNSGNSFSTITLSGSRKTYQLSGTGSLASKHETSKRLFGCGYASWHFNVEGVSIIRTLAVRPSEKPNEGTPAFVVTLQLTNNTRRTVTLQHKEGFVINYLQAGHQRTSPRYRPLSYDYSSSLDNTSSKVVVHIHAKADDPLLFSGDAEMAMADVYPPSVFVLGASGQAKVQFSNENNEPRITGEADISLKPGESKSVSWVVGYYYGDDHKLPATLLQQLELNSGHPMQYLNATFVEQWKKVLPLFESEPNSELRRELIWHAYVLEAMAQYSLVYKETKIPQGTIYDYDWGIHASARDNFQHALPLVWYNPLLAKSVIKYMIQRITPQGEVRLMERGNGYAHNMYYFTSDQQLYFFLLISEYLRVTCDYGLLAEKVRLFPPGSQEEVPVLEVIKRCFEFLRDEVGVGPHALVRLLNSDWNDAIYFIQPVPYNRAFHNAESHMNTTMVLSVLPKLTGQLNKFASLHETDTDELDIQPLIESMELYRKKIWGAFARDLGDRTFSRRMYFYGKSYGEDNMFLEPHGFMLQIPELSLERKKKLYDEMQKRVYTDEKLGARQQESPEFESDEFEKGSRENGGFWYALNGPVIAGVNTFDKQEAYRLFHKMTFNNYAKEFPQYWTSWWSAADNIESSLITTEGLPDQTWIYWSIPVFCAHPHAWILYTYFLLNEP